MVDFVSYAGFAVDAWNNPHFQGGLQAFCKRKMIMSPFSKLEMSPLLSFLAWEVQNEGEGANEYKRG